MPVKVAVVGSLNADVTLWVPRRPSPDETLHAERCEWFRGGKGANQAVAAARLGAEVAMVGRVGDDAWGEWLREGLLVEGIDCAHLDVAKAASGLAVITVDPDDVSIVVSAGANATLGAAEVGAAAAVIERAEVLLLQGEVPATAARVAAEIATAAGTLVVLNPAPYNDVAPAVLPLADVVIVNRAESRQMQADGSAALLSSAALLEGRDVLVVETRGAQGCRVLEGRAFENGTEVARVAAPQVSAVDATGAGDAFAAAFAVSLASGSSPTQAASQAVLAGAAAVTVAGAQPSLPTAAQLSDFAQSVA